MTGQHVTADGGLAALLTEGILACEQDPAAQLARIRALRPRDRALAVHAYSLAAMFAQRGQQRLRGLEVPHD